MKIRVAYNKDNNMGEGTGICVMEGKVTESGLTGWLSGIRQGRYTPANISLVIMSRPRRRDRETIELQNCLLRDFAHWFSKELPGCLPFIYARGRMGRKGFLEPAEPSAVSLLTGCWQDLLEGVLGELTGSGKLPLDFAILLFWDDRYLFCGSGSIYILEYSSSRGVSRWHTCEERWEFAEALGETGNIFFKIRNVREHCLFILSPEPISPEISKISWKKKIGKGHGRAGDRFLTENSGILWAECIPSARMQPDAARLRRRARCLLP